MDRQFGTQFFAKSPSEGQPLLWQHLFWMWGHPWVYVIVLPAISMVSQGLPVNCRRPLVGYTAVALATVLTMVLGLRRVAAPHVRNRPVGPGARVLQHGFTDHRSAQRGVVLRLDCNDLDRPPCLNTSFLFFAGFLIVFIIGGVSGFMTGSVPVDWQLTDTYFVVAHIHYVLIGWNLFAVMAGIYHWFPKMTGRLLSEKIGRWNFWLMFIGFNLGFFPDAHFRPAGHAAARLHLPGKHGLGHAQPHHDDRLLSVRRRASCC